MLEQSLSRVYSKHIKRYEDLNSGAIIKTLQQLKFDEMNYLGYVGLMQNQNGENASDLENLDITYGIFLAIEQILHFSPDESVVHGETVRTYTNYIFGSLNLFHLKSRNLISSRPFFVTHRGDRPQTHTMMLDIALKKFALRLCNPENRFTKEMLNEWQEFFGPIGEQRDIIAQLEGAMDDTFGVAPLCDNCIRIKGDTLDQVTEKQLKTFIRYYFNSKLANYKPTVFLPAFSGKVKDSIHSMVVATKEGDVTYSNACLSGYDDSGQTQLCIKAPVPKNLVKLSLRCLNENCPSQTGNETSVRTYNTMLDIGIFSENDNTPIINSLSNSYKQLLTSTRKPSNVYYFNSLINAIGTLKPETLSLQH